MSGPYDYPPQIPHTAETFNGLLVAAGRPPWPIGQRTSLGTQPVPVPATALRPSQKRKREPRKLDNEKCARCRQDKVKCSPQPRFWPQKCERCLSKGLSCSEGEVKRRAGKKISPSSLHPPGPTRQKYQASEIRDQVGQGSAELHVDYVQESWDHADLTNLVAFVQLLNHERSLLVEASSYLEKLNLHVRTAVLHNEFDESWRLEMGVPKLSEAVRKLLRDFRRSESLTMTDRILYEYAHEAVGEDFAVPRNDPISEGSLAELPIGVQVRHLIRKLRLDIQRCGSCDFKPLYRLLRQLGHKRPQWAERFGSFAHFDWFSSSLLFAAAYSLVVSQECLTEPLIRIWVRDYILRSGDEVPPFPITRFAEIWNADSDSVDIFTLVGGDAGDSTKLPLLYIAVLSNKPRIVRALVKDDFNTKPELTFARYSIFHFAASTGSVHCYRELLRCENGKAMEGEPGYADDLPLHIAATNGHKHSVDYILGLHSDNATYVNERNLFSETPLMQAAESGQYDVVQFLLDYPEVDVAAFDDVGRTALDHAHGNEDIFRLILSKFTDQYFNTIEEDGATPLHRLAKYAGGKAMEIVLGLPSILPDKEDEDGRTPLCNAVSNRQLETVKVLAIRRDVDVTKLSKVPRWYGGEDSIIQDAKKNARENDEFSRILDWLKIHCKELEADLADWEISTKDAVQEGDGSE